MDGNENRELDVCWLPHRASFCFDFDVSLLCFFTKPVDQKTVYSPHQHPTRDSFNQSVRSFFFICFYEGLLLFT